LFWRENPVKGDGHLYIVYDAKGKVYPRTYRMRALAKAKAEKLGGTVRVIPDGVARKERSEAPPEERSPQAGEVETG
jgi:hypothetical protein